MRLLRFPKLDLRHVLAEIAIVMVGILLALWVNDWNQARQDRATERRYLLNLREDVAADAQGLHDEQVAIRGYIASAERVLEVLRGATGGTADPAQFVQDVDHAGFLRLFQPRDYTFRDMVATGSLRLLRNDRLKRSLVEYYGSFDALEFFTDAYRDQTWDRYDHALEDVLDPLAWQAVKESELCPPEERRREAAHLVQGQLCVASDGSQVLASAAVDPQRLVAELRGAPRVEKALLGVVSWSRQHLTVLNEREQSAIRLRQELDVELGSAEASN